MLYPKLLFIACLAIVPGLCSSTACGQGIAIVDIGAIFRAHGVFTQQLDAIRAEADSFKNNSMQMQREFARKVENLRQLPPDSTEFREQESRLAKEAAVLEVGEKEQMRKLMLAEAKLHFSTYQQINQLISKYCNDQSITLVLKFTNEPMDEANPNSIMQRVNNPLLYHKKELDITPTIISLLPGSTQLGSNPKGTSQR